jgi:hypothetical protein
MDMIATIVGVLVGGAAVVFTLPWIAGQAAKYLPDKEGFGMFEVVTGGLAFVVGIAAAGLAASLTHAIVGGRGKSVTV